jgi:ubiquitin fusion degradation protein 1
MIKANYGYPILFQICNKRNNRYSHAGALEFIAEEGRVYLPPWVKTIL